MVLIEVVGLQPVLACSVDGSDRFGTTKKIVKINFFGFPLQHKIISGLIVHRSPAKMEDSSWLTDSADEEPKVVESLAKGTKEGSGEQAVGVSVGGSAIERREASVTWEIKSSEIKLGAKLGQGAFGAVYKGKLRGQEVAVKVLQKQKLDSDTLEAFRKEVAIMSKLRQPHLLLFMGACTEPGNLMIVTEYMSKGSVHDLLYGSGKTPLSFKRKMLIAKQAALGMNWLHCSEPPFIHRDLKSANLLVDDNWTVKVSDFGLSQVKPEDDLSMQQDPTAYAGTPLWMAPEVLMRQPFDEKADVYSFGLLLWELLMEQTPFQSIKSLKQLVQTVCVEHKRPEIPPDCTPTLRSLIHSCWQPSPKDRPTFAEILSVLDDVIVEALIADNTARRFWREKCGDKVKLLWKDFMTAFATYVHEKQRPFLPLTPEAELKLACLKQLVANNPDQEVSIEDFAWCVTCFGPWEDASILSRMENLLRKRWFFGFLSADEAEKKLSLAHKRGTFLVRFSMQDPGSYSISVRDSVKGKALVKHYRVLHKPGGPYVIGGSQCNELEEVIAKYNKEMRLKRPCDGWPYEALFPDQASEIGRAHV